ncbi:histidine phosphatase family protein [Actinoplanes auranticolor]|uniref:Phosphoglycerate mutase n=1 Tax=Actinoplanes auranticolor TaxID=47988 RepID=A0A919VNK3_9ACTN|nr:histidine phosphatase family protein [Actinoplanes auranticolor]GIM70000.1 phosphoglycerate mutase [Actinoplanes auranticolor]
MSHRYLYLARHGEAVSEEAGLSDPGRRQAELLGARLAGVPFASVTHSPLPRAAETAAAWPQAQSSDVVGDYPPWVPADVPAAFSALTEGWGADELRDGPELAQQALARFAVPAEQETYELVITHSFLIAWFVRDALGAPPERWMGINTGNAALTVIRYSEQRPPALMLYNDMAHLPPELRWTGFPPHLRVR